jgi:hypothetical protein
MSARTSSHCLGGQEGLNQQENPSGWNRQSSEQQANNDQKNDKNERRALSHAALANTQP